MSDPFNQLPADPAWVALCDSLTAEAAAKLCAMVVMVVMQPGGKMGVTIEGVPPDGPMHEAAQDIPYLLELTAKVLRMMDESAATRLPQ